MGFWNSLFGIGRPSKNDFIRNLAKQRLRQNPMASLMGLSESMVDSLGPLELVGLPESTIATIVETYAMLKKHRATDHEILGRIEAYRSSIGSGEMPNPLNLESYIQYRVKIEHGHGAPISAQYVAETVRKCCQHFGCPAAESAVPRKIISGGDGSSLDKALIVNAANSDEGVPAEWRYLVATFGRKDVDWSLDRKLLQESNGRHYDVFTLKLKDGQKKVVYLDITSFYGRF